jgi:hypothetical protein
LQSIFCDFAEYVRLHKLKEIKVCCDNGMTTTFEIAYTQEPFHTTSIGLGWKEFCDYNKIGAEDAICFKFDNINPNFVAHLYKLDE